MQQESVSVMKHVHLPILSLRRITPPTGGIGTLADFSLYEKYYVVIIENDTELELEVHEQNLTFNSGKVGILRTNKKSIAILHPHQMTKIIILLSSAALGFVGGIIEMYCFIKIFPEEAVRGMPPYEPEYLIFGVILLSLGFLFLYQAFRSHKKYQ